MTTVRTLQVDADGTMTLRRIQATLPAMQAAVGGHIEAVTGMGWHAYMNEDGRERGMEPNPRATTLIRLLRGHDFPMVVGPVIFLGSHGTEEGHVPDRVIDTARELGDIKEEDA